MGIVGSDMAKPAMFHGTRYVVPKKFLAEDEQHTTVTVDAETPREQPATVAPARPSDSQYTPVHAGNGLVAVKCRRPSMSLERRLKFMRYELSNKYA